MADRVLAIFKTASEAVAAAEDLRRTGFSNESISLCTAEPIHSEIEKQSGGRKSRIGIFAIAGGVTGAALAVGLTALTSIRMNLVTGGMPIVAWWAFGIIVFEMTALGAILSTLGRMIFEARLRWQGLPETCDRAVSEGKAVVVVHVGAGGDFRPGAAEEMLARRGAEVL